MIVSPQAEITLITEQAHACVGFVAEQTHDPVMRLVQLSYIQQHLDELMVATEKEAMPALEELKVQRKIKHDRYSVKVHGVLVQVELPENAYMYTKSSVYRRVSLMLHRIRKGMRAAARGADNGYPAAILRPGRREIIVHFSGNMTQREQPEEDIDD